MASTFKDFRKQFSLVWKNQHKRPYCSFVYIGFMIFFAGCVLEVTCLAYGASWIFTLLCILLGMAGSMIICIGGFKILSTQSTELLPLVSSQSKNPKCKTVLKKTSSKECGPLRFPAEEERKNDSVNTSLHCDNFYGYDPHLTYTKTENINEKNEKITYVDCNLDRYAKVCHEQYITGPAPRGSNNRRTGDERQPQVRGARNFFRKIFRLPPFFKKQVSNLTPEVEIQLRDFHQNMPEEESFPDVELSRSVTAEESGGIPKDILDSVGMQTEQSASTNIFQRTYENLLPSMGQKVMIPQTSRLNSATQQDLSDIQGSFDVASPYQNVPSHVRGVKECSPSKLDKSSTHTGKSVSFSPERYYGNIVARNPPKTYPDYENVYQIRPGHYVPVHSQGPYYNITAPPFYNITEPWPKSRQSKAVSDTTSRSVYHSPEKNDLYSSQTDRRSLLSPIAISEKRMTSKRQLSYEDEEVSGKRNQPVDTFPELGVSSPYANIPASSWQRTKYRQYKDVTENIKQSSLLKMDEYSNVFDKISHENLGTRNKCSNTQLQQNLMFLSYDFSHLNMIPSFDSEQQQTSIHGTPKRHEQVFPPRSRRTFEDEERMLKEMPYERSNIPLLEACYRTDNDKTKIFQPKEKKSIPLALDAYPNIHLSENYEQYRTEIPGAALIVQDMNQSKRSKCPSTTEKRISTGKTSKKKEIPQERDFQISPGEFQFQTKGFSNKLYCSTSELETKRCNVPQLHYAHPFVGYKTDKTESKQDYDAESEDSTVFAGLHTDWKRKEGIKTRTGKIEPSSFQRLEHGYETGTGPLRMSHTTPHSSRLQRTEYVQHNPTYVEREYDNPIVGKTVHSTEKQLIQTEKVPGKVLETEEKKSNVLRSQVPISFAAGSLERSTQCQVSERAEAGESSTAVFGDDRPLEKEKSACNKMNETTRSQEKISTPRIGNPKFYPTRCLEDAPVKTEISPQRAGKRAMYPPQKFKNPFASLSYDLLGFSKLTCESQENKSSSYFSPTEKYESFLENYNKKSDGSQTGRIAEAIHSYSEGTSQKPLHFVSDYERNIIPVLQYKDDADKLDPCVARTMSSESTNESLVKSSVALSVTESSHGSQTRSPVVSFDPQHSPSRVKALIQVHGINPSPRLSCQDVPPSQQRFAAPSEKINLPVISSVSSTIAHYPLTQARSASVQQLKTLSPLKNRPHCSDEPVSGIYHPEYAASLEHKLSKLSPTRKACPIYPSSSSSSQMIATSPATQCLEKSAVTTGRQLKKKSASKQPQKSVRAPLPETPLTLLRSPKKTP